MLRRSACGGTGVPAFAGRRQQIRIRSLNFCQSLRSPYDLLQALIIKLVRSSPCSAPAKNRAHRNPVIFFGNVLMNGVVRKASERRTPAIKKALDFISSRVLLDAGEDLSGLILSQH